MTCADSKTSSGGMFIARSTLATGDVPTSLLADIERCQKVTDRRNVAHPSPATTTWDNGV